MRKGRMGRKGFTMVELMVSLAIAAILAMSLIGIVAPVYRTYRRTLNRADAQMIAGNVLDSMRKSAMRAAAVKPAKEGAALDVGNGLYQAVDGRLVFTADTADAETPEDQPVFDKKYYGGKRVTLAVAAEGDDGTVALVTVTVSGADGELCRLSGVASTLRGVLTGGTTPANP